VIPRLLILGWFLAASLAVPARAADVEALLRAGRVGEAVPAARAEARQRPDDLDVQERWIDLALSVGIREQALAPVEARLQADPGDADAHYLMGRLALSADEAVTHYEAALARAPAHPRAPMGLAAIHRARGQLAEAVTAYRTALSRDPSLTEAWGGIQASLLLQGEREAALATAREAMAAVPDAPEPYLAVATLEPDRAREVLAEGVRRAPEDPRLHLTLARAHLDAGDGPAAMDSVRRALERAPHSAEGQYLAMASRDVAAGDLDAEGWGRLDAAIRESGAARTTAEHDAVWSRFVQLTTDHPQCALCWIGRARAMASMNRLDRALFDARKAAGLAPTEAEVQATLGLLLLLDGQHDASLDWLRRAEQARPQDASLAIARLKAEEGAGHADEARRLAVEALARFPYDRRIILEVAGLIGRQGDPDGAYLVLREGLERRPDPVIVVALAAAARDAGYLAEAVEILERLAAKTDLPRARELADRLRAELRATAGPAGPR
jgi:tetratricopeptide (TPR) repeat protein